MYDKAIICPKLLEIRFMVRKQFIYNGLLPGHKRSCLQIDYFRQAWYSIKLKVLRDTRYFDEAKNKIPQKNKQQKNEASILKRVRFLTHSRAY